jgi:glycerate 2-kinase
LAKRSVLNVRVLAAADKFRGTATAQQVCAAIAEGVRRAGHEAVEQPLADGGEGLLDVLGGPNRTTLVAGPLGEPVRCAWSLRNGTAIIEMARASGLELLGGAANNDSVAASTSGTGELISAALDAGARRIIVGLGGSATTDGGWGAVQALHPLARLKKVRLDIAVDVSTQFVDAAAVFAPQKGASAAQVALLQRRLERLVGVYIDTYGVDVSAVAGAGAAGGLAGGLMALGGIITGGFDLVAKEVDLSHQLSQCDLVITGEGFLDEGSFAGKVVGGVVQRARQCGVAAIAIAGDVFDGVGDRVESHSLVERFGEQRSLHDTEACISELAHELVNAFAVQLGR